MTTVAVDHELAGYLTQLGDDNVVLGQRLAEYVSNAPELEEDLAVGNLALDHLGVATHLYEYSVAVEGKGRSADDLAFLRTEREFTNLLLVEQPNRDFAHVMARQLFFDAYQLPLWGRLATSSDTTLAGIAARAEKEARYHLRHSSGWVVRLGDGTTESHQRMQAAVDALWHFTGEPFETDNVSRDLARSGVGADGSALRSQWDDTVVTVLTEATLTVPADPYQATGGRSGRHTEHLGLMLAEMQWMQRTYPGLSW